MKNKLIKNESTETPDRWKQFNWIMQILICFVGFVVVGIVSFGFYGTIQLYQKYYPLTDASMEMRIEAIIGYLWFEEMLGGDESKNMGDIINHLDQADWYAKAMVEGGESEHLRLLPFKESQFDDSIKNLQSQLKRQRELMYKRIKTIPTSGPGLEIDKNYHTELENFVKHANKFEMDIKHIMANGYQVFKFIGLGVIACCVFLFSIIGYGFYSYESLRRKSYLKILQMESILVQREKMAALGIMISGITHEINNPNGVILLNLPILKDYLQELIPIVDDYAEKNSDFILFNMPYKDFRKDLHRLLENITNGSNRINRIVSDLKEFSLRKDKTKRDLFEIKDVIRKMVDRCGSKINRLVNSFEINVPEDMPQVYCDPDIVELILTNFLINAAEAADKKNSWINLNVFSKKKKPNGLIIEVKDNGSGINKNNMDKIFDPFFSTKSSKKGAGGMGLYLCKTLADQIGAVVEVDSEIGKGSTFRLKLNEIQRADI